MARFFRRRGKQYDGRSRPFRFVRTGTSLALILAAATILSLLAPLSQASSGPAPIRIGVLQFGTASWELDTIKRHGLDRAGNLDLQVLTLANSEAGKVALKAGAADMIVTDWVWVARQRADGDDLAFVPFSRAVGALEVPAGSPVASLSDLAGKRIGVAGGPLDKNWILLRALARRELGRDLADIAQPVFGGPPLLQEELAAGRLDAVLTFWNFAARLESQGARPLLTVAEIIRRLGMSPDVPMLGYAFHESWARQHGDVLDRFVEASRSAKQLLAQSDDEWRALAPMLGTEDPKLQALLRDGYRAGIPGSFGEAQRDDAARLFAILVESGGSDLLGSARVLDPGTFWAMAE